MGVREDPELADAPLPFTRIEEALLAIRPFIAPCTTAFTSSIDLDRTGLHPLEKYMKSVLSDCL